MKTMTLNDGHMIPTIGLGVWDANGHDAVQAVIWALEAGYRLIDTAALYGNEAEVGQGMRESTVSRNDIFLTTKVWNDDQGYESTLAAMDRSLERLGMDYVDLYLVHWPSNDPQTRRDTWRAMEKILKDGKARSIGVSNYTTENLEEMKTYATVMPAVNQIEFHPFWFRKDLMDYCHKNNIAVEDYSPLSRAQKLGDNRITAIAKKYRKSNAQILIRWALQHGNIVIPKSVHKERIEENIGVFNFEISDDDMRALDQLNENYSIIFGNV